MEQPIGNVNANGSGGMSLLAKIAIGALGVAALVFLYLANR